MASELVCVQLVVNSSEKFFEFSQIARTINCFVGLKASF
jgi:hypothetical protein